MTKTSKLRIVYEPVEKLKPANYNPRTISEKDLRSLVKNMSEFGHLGILIANRKTNNLISGHQRLKVAKLLKMKEIAVVWIDVSLRKEKILNIGMNKISGEWDMPMLKDLLEEVDNGEGDMDMTGFDEVEIEMLMTEFHQDELEEDEVPEPPEKPITKTGDLWLLGEHRVLCGDCTKEADMEALRMDGNIGGLIADPPYGMRLDTDYSQMGKSKRAKEFSKSPPKKHNPVRGDGQDFDASVIRNQINIKEQFWFGADYYAKSLGDTQHSGSWLVWDKRTQESADRGFGSCFELIWSKQSHKRLILRHKWFGFMTDSGENRQFEHPTEKSCNLIIDLIKQWISGDVYDPFLGSGTTLIAAEHLNRKCYGIEIEPRYVDVIIKRWENLTGKKAKLLTKGDNID